MNNLSKWGIFKSKGRLFKEPNNKYRTPFQRDRDRIIHSASFRRLKHKTQVFVNTDGDHFRTRITHSIEVAQIARSIARYLGLNDDLAETVSLAHDLGHTPFGHAGEEALHECMEQYGGFDHNLQTLRIVMFVENKYLSFPGLNLTTETLSGLLKHNGPINNLEKLDNILGIRNFNKKINFDEYSSLESQIAAISDDIAYNNHDIQDGIKAGIFNLKDLLEINFFKNIYDKYPKKFKYKNNEILIYQIIRDSINLMVKDIINNIQKNIKNQKIKKTIDIYKCKNEIVCFSNSYKKIDKEIRYFLKENMYKNKNVLKRNNEGKKIVTKLFREISKRPNKFIIKNKKKVNFRDISDYISGMTDRYAINLYKKIKWIFLRYIKKK